MSASLRIACVSGHSRWWRKQRLVAKYFQMRLAGVIYPDVYCLALMLSDKFDFLLEGEKVAPGQYDLILAELQSFRQPARAIWSRWSRPAIRRSLSFPGRRRFSPAISPTPSCAA